jgi:penicillin-binding protein 2
MANGSRYFMEGERPIPDGRQRGPEPQPRVFALLFLMFVTFSVFGIRIAWLQTVEGSSYRALADRNRYKRVAIEAPRGVLYDRTGKILVRNEPSFDVVIVPALLPTMKTARRDLARLGNCSTWPARPAR